MPTTLTADSLYAAYAHQLQKATSALAALGQAATGDASLTVLPGTALTAFDTDTANVGGLGHLSNSNGLWYNRKTGFVGEVVVNADKVTVVFREVSPDDSRFWSLLGVASQTESEVEWDASASANAQALVDDALALTRAAIAQFGAANVTVAGEAQGGGLATDAVSTLGVDGYTVAAQPVGYGRSMSAMLQAAANLQIDVTSAATITALEKVARQFDMFAATNEDPDQGAGFTVLAGVIGPANVPQSDFMGAYQSALSTYDANIAAHAHVVAPDTDTDPETSTVVGGPDTTLANGPGAGSTGNSETSATTSADPPSTNSAGGPPYTGATLQPASGQKSVADASTESATGSAIAADPQSNVYRAMADIKSLIGGNGPGTVSDLHNDIPDSAWSGHVFYFDPADAAHAATAAADYFVYNDNGAGNNVITDFTVGFAAGHDVVIFSHSVFADWAHLLAASTQVGADTVITVDPANSITLTGVSLTALAADDFKFV